MDGNGMAAEAGRIDVVSCGIGFPKDAETLGLIGRADVVYGSRALLAACPVEAHLTRIIGAKARDDAADALTLCRVGRHVVILASGDALYHGFGGTLSGMAHPHDTIVYHPGITAFQALFHRLGLPWQDARLFSAHSGEALAARAIAEAPLSVAYAGSRYPAHAIAQAVLKLHPASAGRAAVIAERLGSPEEHLFSGPLADLARTKCGPTSILLLLPTPWHCVPHTVARIAHDARLDCGIHEGFPISRSIPAPILTLGFPEEDYERENNLITASDVRAVILSRLRLPAWGTLWDIGAGSGSVGLEAAGLRPNLNVVGIERKPERGAIIERNRARLGVSNYTLYIGDALELIHASSVDNRLSYPYGGTSAAQPNHQSEFLGKKREGEMRSLLQKDFLSPSPGGSAPFLPPPDRVFIGGGGRDLPELLAACMERMPPGGIMAASAVTLESFHALSVYSPERRIGLCSLNIAHEQPIAGTSHHLKQQNTIYLFTFQKEITS